MSEIIAQEDWESDISPSDPRWTRKPVWLGVSVMLSRIVIYPNFGYFTTRKISPFLYCKITCIISHLICRNIANEERFEFLNTEWRQDFGKIATTRYVLKFSWNVFNFDFHQASKTFTVSHGSTMWIPQTRRNSCSTRQLGQTSFRSPEVWSPFRK